MKWGSRNHLLRVSSEHSRNTVSASLNPALLARIPAVYSILEFEPRPAGRYVRAELVEECAALRRPFQAAMMLSPTGPACPHSKQRTLRPPATTSTPLGYSSCSHQ